VNTQQSKAIVLTRINYGESDRIITVLTPDHGKMRLIAKGVRKVKSKLAGGIELFSVFDASFITGRGEIGTLVSARLVVFYSNILKDIERVQLGYEILKTVNKNTEDNAEDDYFYLISILFRQLDNLDVSISVIRAWYHAQLLSLSGHGPNLSTDDKGNDLDASLKYLFNIDRMCFTPSIKGRFNQRHIKYLRLLFSDLRDQKIFGVVDAETINNELRPTLQAMFNSYLSL
jgi:DNA repair protein RecO